MLVSKTLTRVQRAKIRIATDSYLLQYFEEGKLPARDFFGVKFLTELSVVAEVLAAACEHVPLKF